MSDLDNHATVIGTLKKFKKTKTKKKQVLLKEPRRLLEFILITFGQF